MARKKQNESLGIAMKDLCLYFFFTIWIVNCQTLIKSDDEYYTLDRKNEEFSARMSNCKEQNYIWKHGKCFESKGIIEVDASVNCKLKGLDYVWDGQFCVQESTPKNFYRYCIDTDAENSVSKFIFETKKFLRIKNCQRAFSSLMFTDKLDLSHRGLTTLKPIYDLDNLEVLILDHNDLESLDELRGLKALTRLSIKNNQIHSLDPLKSLLNLQDLDLSSNPIHDLNSLANLPKLTGLNIEETPVLENLSPENCPMSAKSHAIRQICHGS